MSGWSRALAIAIGLFAIGLGFTAIFFPAIVVGFITVLFSIAFILMGLWALATGIAGQRTTISQPMRAPTSREPSSTVRDQETTTQ